MSNKEIKRQIHLLTTIKLMLQIDNRMSDWKDEDELYLIQLNKQLQLTN